jgi:ornithine decarboxylase
MAPFALSPTTEQYHLSNADLKSVDSCLASTANHGPAISKQLIGQALERRVLAVDTDTCEPGEDDAFFVADLGEVYRQHMRWKKNLARVKPHYGELWPTFSLYSIH